MFRARDTPHQPTKRRRGHKPLFLGTIAGLVCWGGIGALDPSSPGQPESHQKPSPPKETQEPLLRSSTQEKPEFLATLDQGAPWAYACFEQLQKHPESIVQACQHIADTRTPPALKRTLTFVLAALTDPAKPQNMHPLALSAFLEILNTQKDPELIPWVVLSLSSWRGSPNWPGRFNFAANALYTHATPEGLSIALREPIAPELTPLVVQALEEPSSPGALKDAAVASLRFSLSQRLARQAMTRVALDPQDLNRQDEAAEALALWVANERTLSTQPTVDALLQAASTPGAHALRLKTQGYLYSQDFNEQQTQKLIEYLDPSKEFTLRNFALYLLGGQARTHPSRWAPVLHTLATQDAHPKIREYALDALKKI